MRAQAQRAQGRVGRGRRTSRRPRPDGPQWPRARGSGACARSGARSISAARAPKCCTSRTACAAILPPRRTRTVRSPPGAPRSGAARRWACGRVASARRRARGNSLDRALAQQRVQRAQGRALARARAGMPLVSRSSRCTSSSDSSGRTARSASMTPKLSPLPPWTARPAGLSSTSSALVLVHDRRAHAGR